MAERFNGIVRELNPNSAVIHLDIDTNMLYRVGTSDPDNPPEGFIVYKDAELRKDDEQVSLRPEIQIGDLSI